MLQPLLLTLLGAAIGTVTGLLPGLHPNTVIFLSLPLMLRLPPGLVLPLISATAIVHSLLNHIPSILIGAPDSGTALSSLPGKQLLLQGKGITASLIGLEAGIYAVLAAAILLIPTTVALPAIYSSIGPALPYIVTVLFTIPLLDTDRPAATITTAAAAALLGTVTLSLDSVNTALALFPLFTGMFGIATILPRLTTTVPPQDDASRIATSTAAQGAVVGTVAGFIAGIIPGIGPSSSISLFTPYISGRKERIASVGSINTADAIISLLAVYIIGKARSGASVAVQKLVAIDRGLFLLLLGTSLLAAGLGYTIGRGLLIHASGIYNSLDKQRLSRAVILFIVVGVIATTGLTGAGILAAATGVGLYCEHSQARKRVCMACLIVPYLLFRFGLTL